MQRWHARFLIRVTPVLGVCVCIRWCDYAHERVHVKDYLVSSFVSIGERLREERDRLGYTQAGFADALGVSRNSQVNYESGAREPDASYLAGLQRLGADVMYVLTGQRPLVAGESLPPSPMSRRERALLDNYANTDEEGRRAIERLANLEAQSAALKKA